MHRLAVSLYLCLGFSLVPPAAQAQETLRERIKARIEQRRADKGSEAATAKGGLQELQVRRDVGVISNDATLPGGDFAIAVSRLTPRVVCVAGSSHVTHSTRPPTCDLQPP